MSTVTTKTYTCDFCGYGGPYSRAEGFTHHADGVDLCRWCSDPKQVDGGHLECGRHVVTFADGAWACSCGERFNKVVIELLTPKRVLAALPNIVLAAAYIHSEQP